MNIRESLQDRERCDEANPYELPQFCYVDHIYKRLHKMQYYLEIIIT